MIGGAEIERMLALCEIAPFDVLKESELLLIARHMHHRAFAPEQVLYPSGKVADFLTVELSGAVSFRRVGTAQPSTLDRIAPVIGSGRVFGAASILFGLNIERNMNAGPDGLIALCLARPHLFTIARECPDFIVGLSVSASAHSSREHLG